MPELQQRLSAALSWRNISPRQASLEAGLNENAVQRILTLPNYQPDVGTLRRVASYFGLDAAELLYLAGHMGGEAGAEPPDPLQTIGRALSREWSEQARQALLTLVALTRGR